MPHSSIRTIIADWLPPAVNRLYKRYFRWRWFRGNYSSWADATHDAGTYGEQEILGRVLKAALAVRDGRAAFERDGVTFAEPRCEEGLLAAFEYVALSNRGHLSVLDFGGSLGSTWFQLRPFLPRQLKVDWHIVEQRHFVEEGTRHLMTDQLFFHESIKVALGAFVPNVVLMSGVIQYLERPHQFLDELVALDAPFLLFNNLMLHDKPDRLAVQHTPPDIYRASYPVWFLHRARFFAHFTGRYRVLFDFASSAVWNVDGRMHAGRGCLLVRIKEDGQ